MGQCSDVGQKARRGPDSLHIQRVCSPSGVYVSAHKHHTLFAPFTGPNLSDRSPSFLSQWGLCQCTGKLWERRDAQPWSECRLRTGTFSFLMMLWAKTSLRSTPDLYLACFKLCHFKTFLGLQSILNICVATAHLKLDSLPSNTGLLIQME